MSAIEWSAGFVHLFDEYREEQERKARAELEAARAADKRKNHKFTPMPALAGMVRRGDLPDDMVYELADFLACKHRRGKGQPNLRQVDIERAILWHGWIQDGLNKTSAYEKLVIKEKLENVRSAQRAVKNGFKYMREEIEEMKLADLEARFREIQQTPTTKK